MLVVLFLFGLHLTASLLISNRVLSIRHCPQPLKSTPNDADDTKLSAELDNILTEEEVIERDRLIQIQELKDKEVFLERDTGRWECQACGYIYSEAQGYEKKGIPAGTKFDNIEKFRCPQCGANKKYFIKETETVSGFKENMNYGLGGNALTAGTKSNLIYGGLLAGFLLFMSGYLLE